MRVVSFLKFIKQFTKRKKLSIGPWKLSFDPKRCSSVGQSKYLSINSEPKISGLHWGVRFAEFPGPVDPIQFQFTQFNFKTQCFFWSKMNEFHYSIPTLFFWVHIPSQILGNKTWGYVWFHFNFKYDFGFNQR